MVVTVGSDSHMASAYSMTEISSSEKSPQLSERHLRSPESHAAPPEPALLNTASAPSRRPCWLAGVSSENGAAKTRASTAERLASVAGHETATGRGGSAASSCAPVGLASTSYGDASAVAAGAAVVNSSR
jgi:hypothetical protein